MRVNFHVLVNYYFSPQTNTLTLALAPALVSGECQCTSLSVGRWMERYCMLRTSNRSASAGWSSWTKSRLAYPIRRLETMLL